MIRPYALGVIGLRPWELMRFTPREWKDLERGYGDKNRADLRLKAWAVANLINATGNFKQAVTVESLLKEPAKSGKGKKLTAEEQEAIKRRFGG